MVSTSKVIHETESFITRHVFVNSSHDCDAATVEVLDLDAFAVAELPILRERSVEEFAGSAFRRTSPWSQHALLLRFVGGIGCLGIGLYIHGCFWFGGVRLKSTLASAATRR